MTNENIKHLRQIIEHNDLTNDTTRTEAQVVLDLLEADLREARERERPEVRGLLHAVVKWINAGHLVPNDHEIVSMHTDKKRQAAAKMGVRLAMGAWLSAANKAVEPHENTATPLLDTTLSNLAAALSWLKAGDARQIVLQHGGKGGKFYARIEDDGAGLSDGASDEPHFAIADAMAGMEATP